MTVFGLLPVAPDDLDLATPLGSEKITLQNLWTKAVSRAGGLVVLALALAPFLTFAASIPEPTQLNSGWQLQDSAKVSDPGAVVSSKGFHPQGWFPAMVPGTVLTSMVNAGIYPEPLTVRTIVRSTFQKA